MKTKDIMPRRAADITDAVIKAWKDAYPRGVFRLAVNDEDTLLEEKQEKDERGKKVPVKVYAQKVGYVRKPTRLEIGAAMTIKNDPLLQAEDIFRSCWLGGDEELLDDDDYFQAALLQFQEVIEIKSGEIKKL
jgi:hypothetical protein